MKRALAMVMAAAVVLGTVGGARPAEARSHVSLSFGSGRGPHWRPAPAYVYRPSPPPRAYYRPPRPARRAVVYSPVYWQPYQWVRQTIPSAHRPYVQGAYQNAYQNGYSTGYTTGYQYGYQNGYYDGRRDEYYNSSSGYSGWDW